jgi:hypothetical protein
MHYPRDKGLKVHSKEKKKGMKANYLRDKGSKAHSKRDSVTKHTT